MIVGFPGETDAEFEETLSLTEAVRFHSMFSFKYSERPNTLASKRLPDDVPEEVKTRRIRGLQLLQRRIQLELHEAAVGQRVEVLVDSRSRRRDWEVSGRTTGNTVVNLPGRAGMGGAVRRRRDPARGPAQPVGRAGRRLTPVADVRAGGARVDLRTALRRRQAARS